MRYGLIGRKLGHSFSARFFNDKFADEGIDASYGLYEMDSISRLPRLISEMHDLCGFNVTIPYKEDVIGYLSNVSPAARRIGAVNTVRVLRCEQPEGVYAPGQYWLEGENTDAPGFEAAIRQLLPHPAAGEQSRALVLGTGGASKAVVYALEKMGIGVTLVSRHAAAGLITYGDLTAEVMSRHDIIVNCTPLGMWPAVETAPDIPYQYIDAGKLCFDLVYNPETTEFMRRCKERGAMVSNGLQMLRNQALLAWEFWQRPVVRRYMSRLIIVDHPEGGSEEYELSIAEVAYGADNHISRLEIIPFSEEIPGVIYVDTPLRFRYPER